jgi:hypothetical protein
VPCSFALRANWYASTQRAAAVHPTASTHKVAWARVLINNTPLWQGRLPTGGKRGGQGGGRDREQDDACMRREGEGMERECGGGVGGVELHLPISPLNREGWYTVVVEVCQGADVEESATEEFVSCNGEVVHGAVRIEVVDALRADSLRRDLGIYYILIYYV